MSQVVLFRPKEVYSDRIANHEPPLGLIYLATALKQAGFSVTVIDTLRLTDGLAEARAAITDETILAGVGVMTGYQIAGALNFARAVKEIKPVPIVWGGLHPSLLPEQTLQHGLVDIVAVGEGERTILSLARAARDSSPLDEIPGIFFKQDGAVVKTPAPKSFLDLNELAVPDYSLVDVEYYASYQKSFMDGRKRCLSLNPDRGCPYRCGFCYNLNFNHRRWRCMDPEKILDAISALIEKYNLDAVTFLSDNFCVEEKRVRAVCEGLLERNLDIKWQVDMRIDTFLRYDDELIQLMKRSGFCHLTFGVESGSDRILELIDKDIRVKDVLAAHAKATRLGFNIHYHFMLGFPEETREDIGQTMALIYRLSRDPHVGIYGPSMYVPYPGTPLFDRAVELGFKAPEKLEDWIRYDWRSASKLTWFSPAYSRFLWRTRKIAKRGAQHPTKLHRRLRVKYYRFRLRALARKYL